MPSVCKVKGTLEGLGDPSRHGTKERELQIGVAGCRKGGGFGFYM